MAKRILSPTPLPIHYQKKISTKSEDLISLHHIPSLLVLTPGILVQPLVALIPSLRKRGDPRPEACKRGQSSSQPGVGVGGEEQRVTPACHLPFPGVQWRTPSGSCILLSVTDASSFLSSPLTSSGISWQKHQAWGPQMITDKIQVPGVTRCWQACLGGAWETRSSF